ncbi:E3 ubiquitin-protein ligase MIB2 [Aphelenchoides fujianensis]|nr:E3 ubiquitin-protein ligase MIB2 [Aphelenchoides fujianensis]
MTIATETPAQGEGGFQLDACSTDCGEPSDLVGYPCGHPFSSKCAVEAAEPVRVCPLCKQGLRLFAGFPDTSIVHRAFQKPTDDVVAGAKDVDESEEARKHAEELKKVEQRLEELKSEVQCQLCFDRDSSTAFNCGHRACEQCTARLKECPFCRVQIKGEDPNLSLIRIGRKMRCHLVLDVLLALLLGGLLHWTTAGVIKKSAGDTMLEIRQSQSLSESLQLDVELPLLGGPPEGRGPRAERALKRARRQAGQPAAKLFDINVLVQNVKALNPEEITMKYFEMGKKHRKDAAKEFFILRKETFKLLYTYIGAAVVGLYWLVTLIAVLSMVLCCRSCKKEE